MLYRAVRNDLLRSKTTTVAIMFFVMAAALLVALAVSLFATLSGAIDALMERAETPHLLQMHAGDLDRGRLEAFATRHPSVNEYQVIEFLNVDGARIRVGERSLAKSVQDNGFSVQSDRFDYLLDLNGEVIRVADGETYLPISYRKSGLAKVGDTLEVAGKELTVAGFLRDSQMNSPLSSSKRFLVSQGDFDELRARGSVEYLIEFRVTDLGSLGQLEADYVAAGLEANGPTVTYPLFRVVNGLSDGLMASVILMASVLVLAIALLCIRFTLLARIEDDYREIGVMKAIGLRTSDIKKTYLTSYAAVAAAGSLLGLALAFALRRPLLADIRLYMGHSNNDRMALVVAVVGVLLVFAVIMAFVNGVLCRFRKISPAEAIRFGLSQETPKGVRQLRLSRNSFLGVNAWLGAKDVLARKKTFLTMLAVLTIVVSLITVPRNLLNTISATDFVTYMGLGQYDLRIDIQQTNGIGAKADEIAAAMDSDDYVLRYVVLTTRTFTVRSESGADERIKVELGDHLVFPLTYTEGHAPAAEDEIALSVLNAEALGKAVGDTLTLVIAGQTRPLVVSGIYSDITNGGKTAKAAFTDTSTDAMWSVIAAELADPSLVEGKVAAYAARFEYAKVSGILEFVAQTFGGTIESIRKASSVAFVVALSVTLLVTLLFVRMLVAKDRYSIAVLLAIGFTATDIRRQYATRSFLIAVLGVICGTLLAATLGEIVAGAVIASFGAASFDLKIDSLFAYLISPTAMVVTALAATHAATFTVRTLQIAENIKE